jgi:hypothetical protein
MFFSSHAFKRSLQLKSPEFKPARVSGTVSYFNEKNQRVSVPNGPCEFCDHDGYGPFFLKWSANGQEQQIELSDIEYSQYISTKQFVLL